MIRLWAEKIIAALLACAITAAPVFACLEPAYAYEGELQEAIATGLYGLGDSDNTAGSGTADNGKNSNRSESESAASGEDESGQIDRNGIEPLLEATSENFAEALTQSYLPKEGTFTLTEESRFLIIENVAASESSYTESADADNGGDKEETIAAAGNKSQYSGMLETAELIASEMSEYGLTGETALPVETGTADDARDGDIVIRVVPEDELGLRIGTAEMNQSYRLTVGAGTADLRFADAEEENSGRRGFFSIFDRGNRGNGDNENASGGRDGNNIVLLEACSPDGAYYGLVTLTEMLVEKKDSAAEADTESSVNDEANDNGTPEQSSDGINLDGCEIEDGPDYGERVISLDCGRKYFDREWIEDLIRRSSMQRYNRLVLHFSEFEGFRLDSETFPWLTKGTDSLSREDAAEIVRTAQKYHMKVIPALDIPGHNRYIIEKYESYVKKHPDFAFEYDGKTYDKSSKSFKSIANHYSRNGETLKTNGIGIDITKELPVAFMNALIDDYAGFFRELGCDEWDLGGDEIIGWDSFVLGGHNMSYENRWEFLEHWAKYAKDELGIKKGSASDTFINYLNTVAARLETMGYTCRVFNDDIDINDNQHVELSESIEVTYWNAHDNSAKHFAKAGHRVYNCISMWSYYVLRTENGGDIMDGKYASVNAKNIYNNWEPESFASKKGKNKTVPEGSHGGGYFCIWCDYPDYKSAKTVFKETKLRTWANSSRLWNSEVNSKGSGINAKMSYKDMKGFAENFN